ncbi:MAG TPA: DEAD/DEAH box helicase [Candidatus Kapabacteria bacterium]|nr:DEAD/DEAH box helicase [Candidatus Kapabacteria bacterium]
MNAVFENTWIDILVNDGTNIIYPKNLEKHYRQIISIGAWGEIGNNYYLFIYRNIFRRNLTLDAIIFIYTPFNMEKSIQLIVTDQYNEQCRIDNFLDTAIYFLKKKIPNTLTLEDIKGFYEKVKNIIRDYNESEEIKRKEFENFNFDIRNQEIKINAIQLKKPNEPFTNSHIIKKMQQLKAQVGKNEVGPGDKNKRSCARLGLCLELSESIYRVNRFLPVILPIKKDGVFGTARIIQATQLEKFNFDEMPGLLKEYMEDLSRYSKRWDVGTIFQDTLCSLYFEKMARLFIEMPDELTFYRRNESNRKKLFSLKKLTFKKMDVKFVPTTAADHLKIFIEVTAPDGRVFQPGLQFRLVKNDNTYFYLFFEVSRDGLPHAGTYNNDTYEGDAYFAVPGEPAKFAAFFRFLAEINTISINDFKEVRDALLDIGSDVLVIHPEPIPLYHLEYRPTPVLKICEEVKSADTPKRIEITFDYDSRLQEFLAENSYHIQAHCQKNTHFENMCFLLLKTDPLLKIGQKMRNQWEADVEGEKFFFAFQDKNDIRWLVERGGMYLEKGFKIYSDKRKQYVVNIASNLRIEIRTGVKWLEFKPTLQDGATGEITDLDAVDFYNQMVNDKNGKLHLLKKEDLEKLSRFYKYAEQHGDIFRIPSKNYFLINELYDKRMEEIPELKGQLYSAKKLESFKNIPSYNLSRNFNGKLRKYQVEGFQWLYFLREYKLSGCLADDMGLGKTIQTLALLQTLKERGKLSASLLVAPVSAIPNWEAEIKKFTPVLTVYRHMGNARAKDFDEWYEYDLVITSYATLRNDIELFKEFNFDYIILDESQNIKNFASQTSTAIKVLKSHRRLALSGTPIENNSMELWSLFDFLLPGFLGTHTWFKKQWALPIERSKNKEKIELLKKMVYPFILRRKKEQVETELPAKTEIVQSLQMEEKQMKLYGAVATFYRNLIDKEINEKGLEKSSFKILEGMLRLRQICLFPHLADEKYRNIPTIKFDHFSNLLEDILSVGHKVLVFSQFVKVLNILRDHLDRQNMKYSYIDGSVTLKDREKNVRDFQEKEDIQVFLLSLKAGGVALNLTAADYVIIFDPWWNPAVETQAIDRSHRIGQTKKVIVYRMVVKDTIEEKMLALQDQKKELVEQLITSETKAFKNLSREDIIGLFKF